MRYILALGRDLIGKLRRIIRVTLWSGTPPGALSTGIWPRKPFCHQNGPDRLSIPRNNAQLAAIAIRIAAVGSGLQRERSCVQQGLQTQCRCIAQVLFVRASRRMRLGSVDIRNANFIAIHPECITIDDTILSAPTMAQTKRQGIHGRNDCR